MKALPHTRVHVSGDKMSKVCTIDQVDDVALRCSRGRSQFSFPREEVKSVKLTRYGLSTGLGAVIGLGAGLGIGAAAGSAARSPNEIVSSTAVYAAIGGAGGLIAGGVVGGTTDLLRGPTIYKRR